MYYKQLAAPRLMDAVGSTRTDQPIINLQKLLEFIPKDAKCSHLRYHQREVAVLARLIAQEMGLSVYEQDISYLGGISHDIHKLHEPDDILLGSQKLNSVEFAVIKAHPVMAIVLLSELSIFNTPLAIPGGYTLSEIDRYHHERYSGQGYEGKKELEIPLYSAILNIADDFSAATEPKKSRKYNNRSTDLNDVLLRLAWDNENKHFYRPEVYAAFVSVIERLKSEGYNTSQKLKHYLRTRQYHCRELPVQITFAEFQRFVDRIIQKDRFIQVPLNGTTYNIKETAEPYIIAQTADKRLVTIARADGLLLAELTQKKAQLSGQELSDHGFTPALFKYAGRFFHYIFGKAEFTTLYLSEPDFVKIMDEQRIPQKIQSYLLAKWSAAREGIDIYFNALLPEEEILLKVVDYLSKINVRGSALDKAFFFTKEFLRYLNLDEAYFEPIADSFRFSYFLEYIALLDKDYANISGKDIERNKATTLKKSREFFQKFPELAIYENRIRNFYNGNETDIEALLFSVIDEFISRNGDIKTMLQNSQDKPIHAVIEKFLQWLILNPEYMHPELRKIYLK